MNKKWLAMAVAKLVVQVGSFTNWTSKNTKDYRKESEINLFWLFYDFRNTQELKVLFDELLIELDEVPVPEMVF